MLNKFRWDRTCFRRQSLNNTSGKLKVCSSLLKGVEKWYRSGRLKLSSAYLKLCSAYPGLICLYRTSDVAAWFRSCLNYAQLRSVPVVFEKPHVLLCQSRFLSFWAAVFIIEYLPPLSRVA